MSVAINGTEGVTYNDGTQQSSAPVGRNRIINGNMRIAQRATSVTGSTEAAAYISLDRWASHASGATYNISQESVTVGGETGLPTTFTKYLKFNPTTGADNCGIWQTIEDVDSVQGTYTLSFYAKGTNPAGGSIGISLMQNFGSGGSTTVSTADVETFTLTGTWQRFTFTITPPSITGKTIGAASYYRIFFNQKADDNSATAWTLDITGVQLEANTTATDFEHLQYGQQLALCQRYYYLHAEGTSKAISIGALFTSSVAYSGISFPVDLRSEPSIEVVSPTNFKVFAGNGASNATGVGLWSRSGTTNTFISVTGLARTGGQACIVTTNNAACKLAFSAEL